MTIFLSLALMIINPEGTDGFYRLGEDLNSVTAMRHPSDPQFTDLSINKPQNPPRDRQDNFSLYGFFLPALKSQH